MIANNYWTKHCSYWAHHTKLPATTNLLVWNSLKLKRASSNYLKAINKINKGWRQPNGWVNIYKKWVSDTRTGEDAQTNNMRWVIWRPLFKDVFFLLSRRKRFSMGLRLPIYRWIGVTLWHSKALTFSVSFWIIICLYCVYINFTNQHSFKLIELLLIFEFLFVIIFNI